MGIKSTTTLTRAQALDLYESLRAKLYGSNAVLTDRELGDALDELREEECRREGTTCFDNYRVSDYE